MNYTPEQKACWDKVIDLLQKNLDAPLFNTWIRPLRLYAVTSEALVLIGDSAFNLQHMMKRYGTMLYSTVRLVFGRAYELELHTAEDIPDLDGKLKETTLNDKYTFKNFVVGPSNSFAYAASQAVAEEPSEVYNPLFIYGGVGLGKTHLMNAIGNAIKAADPSANVLLMTSETITNQLIEAIAKKSTAELRARLRNVDVLMVDDIQFLSKTRSSQEEFFHTFNELHSKKKQIIISSDRPPKEIPEIEERLRSRFEWGLIVDIQKPDFETRVAILRQKADEENIDIPYDVMEFIAQNVNSNIRELEGCLTSLNAHAQLMGLPITLELARTALSNRIGAQTSRKVTAELILEVVARQFGVTVDDLTGKKRSREIATPRQIAMYICREMTSLSTTSIGIAFGGRDHTTVMHGCDKIADSMKADFAFKRRVEELMDLVENN